MSKSRTISAEELQKISLKEIEFPHILNIISNYAISELGRNIVNNIEPYKDIRLLRDELSQVEELRQLLLKNEDLPFGNLSDIYSLLHKSRIDNAVLAPGEIYKIFELSKSARNIKSFIRSRSEDLPLIFRNSDLLIDDRIFEKHISESIDESGNVKDSASRELSRIRKEIIENKFVRTYIKDSEGIDLSKDMVNNKYVNSINNYAIADICRTELLVEIEAYAEITKKENLKS